MSKSFIIKVITSNWNKDVIGNVFHCVREVEEDVAQKERQRDMSSSGEDKAIFSEA